MLIRNTAVNAISVVASLALAFLTTGLLAGSLEQAAFGLLVLVRAIVGNVGLLETLFGAGITRYVAFHQARGEPDRRDVFVGTGLAVNMVQGVVVSLIAIGVGYLFFDRFFAGVPAPLAATGPSLLAMFFGVLLVQIVSSALLRALEGMQAYPAARMTETTSQVLLFGLLYLALRLTSGRSLMWLAAGYLVSEVVRVALLVFWLRRLGLSIPFWRVDWTAFKTLFAFGKPLAIGKLFTTLSYRGDALLLGIFSTLQAVATYQVANQIWAGAVAGMSALTAALLPVVARHAAEGAPVATLFLRASRYTIAAAIMLATLVIFSRHFVLEHWVTRSYAAAAPLVVLFMVQLVIAFHQGVSNLVALGSDKHQPVGWYEGAGAVVNIIVSLLLIRSFGAKALLIGAIVKACIVAPLNAQLALRVMGIGAGEFLRAAVLPAWRFGAAVAATAWVVKSVGPVLGTGILSFFLQVAAVTTAAALAAWAAVLTDADRQALRRAVW